MRIFHAALSIVLLGGSPVAIAQTDAPTKIVLDPPIERPASGIYQGEPGIDADQLTEAFLAGHPDLRWRREGLYSYNRKQYDVAQSQFLRAAHYGDKPAQAMLAEMHWQGTGVAQDRALGYAWMDIAAERQYPTFLILRERYWSELSEAERQAAIEKGRPLMDEYGDAAAKPRQAKAMRKGSRSVTGSRTGFSGFVTIIPNTGPMAGMTVSADEYYADKYWKPNQYWAMQDEQFKAPLRPGRVDVGDVEAMRRQPPAADAVDSDEPDVPDEPVPGTE